MTGSRNPIEALERRDLFSATTQVHLDLLGALVNTSPIELSATGHAGGRGGATLTVPPIDLNLLGLAVTTSDIDAWVAAAAGNGVMAEWTRPDLPASAAAGDGKLLGNVLTGALARR